MNAGQKIKEVTPKHVIILFLIFVLLGLIWNAASGNTRNKKKCKKQAAFERVVETTQAIGETTVEGVKETGKAVKEVIQLEEKTVTAVDEQADTKEEVAATNVTVDSSLDTDKQAADTTPEKEAENVVKKITTEVEVIINVKTPDGKPIGSQPIVLDIAPKNTNVEGKAATTKSVEAKPTENAEVSASTQTEETATADPINKRIDEKIEILLKEIEQLKSLKENLQSTDK